MIRLLKKLKPDGTPYTRRLAVDEEIEKWIGLELSKFIESAKKFSSKSAEFISTEAVLYFARQAVAVSECQEALVEILLERLHFRLPRPDSIDGNSESLTAMNVREDVRDRFVDLLLQDRQNYEDRLDYYEVNFNHAVAADRLDASRRHWSEENRGTVLENAENEVLAVVEAAVGADDPFDPGEMDRKVYRLMLDAAIASLPELQRRIIEMLRKEIPIDSNDSSVLTIRRTLGKSEKTIRTHRDLAFASLRRRLENRGGMR